MARISGIAEHGVPGCWFRLLAETLIATQKSANIEIVSRQAAANYRLPRDAPQILLRHGRGDEFLEARIIPERIEHWIEPEQRRSERRAHTHCATVRDGE
jgi:hypothetical protein